MCTLYGEGTLDKIINLLHTDQKQLSDTYQTPCFSSPSLQHGAIWEGPLEHVLVGVPDTRAGREGRAAERLGYMGPFGVFYWRVLVRGRKAQRIDVGILWCSCQYNTPHPLINERRAGDTTHRRGGGLAHCRL